MASRKIRSLSGRAYRARRTASAFGRVYLGIKANQFLDRAGDEAGSRERWKRFHRNSAESIFAAAIELRGLILKGCQFMGARSDLLPPAYVEVLSRLQDRVPPRPFAEIRAVVEHELHMPLEKAFAEFSREPLASASLAQVHEARLSDGRRVAVKVQYPEIRDLVASDLSNLGTLFRALRLFEQDFDFVPLIDEFREQLPRELDFYNEALNAERIAEFFQQREDLCVPEIHWKLTTSRVLVSDFVDGIKISNIRELEAAGIEPKRVMQSLLEAYCEQILVHGFFHADPHPGNLLVLRPSPGHKIPRIVFLDFGLSKQLPASFRQSTVEFAAALLQGKAEEMGKALVGIGFETRDNSQQSLHAISVILLDVAKRLREQTYLDPAVVREAGGELPRLIRENPIIRIPSHLVLVGRVIGLLSGLGHTLDVKLDMLKTILPYASGVSPGPGIEREHT